jgi:alkylhydroperoxidase family enzyme
MVQHLLPSPAHNPTQTRVLTSQRRNSFIGAIRTKTSLPTSIRETAICRVAVLNKAWYEWESHSPILRAAEGGITGAHVDAVLQSAPRTVKEGIQDAKHAAVLRYTDAMTLDVQVPQDVFAELRTHMSEREIVELTASVAAYNCVSRFLVALDVGETNGQAGPEKEWEL